jgi:hypothetical protein
MPSLRRDGLAGPSRTRHTPSAASRPARALPVVGDIRDEGQVAAAVAQAAARFGGIDVAYAVITRPSRDCTGNAFLCEDVLAAGGVTDFDQYACQPGAEPEVDLFVDHA